MRIFHIITHFDLGGAEKVALNICESSNANFNYHLVEVVRGKGRFSEAFVQEIEKSGISYHRAPLFCINNKLGIMFFAFWFTSIVARCKPDVIHVHTEVPELSVFLWHKLFGWLFPGVKFVRTIHNTELWNSWKSIGKKVERFYISKKANIAISASVKDCYKTAYGENPKIIYNGVAESPQKVFEGIVAGKYNILFAGRLEHQKGINELCEVVQKLVSFDKLVFHIVGTGSLGEKVDALKTLPNVRIYDKIYGLSQYLASFDFIFMPSNHEGLALLSIEAAMAKVPAIINPCPGLRDTLPDDWELKVENNSVEQFVEIFTHLDSFNRDSLGEKAYKFVQDKFSIEKMQREYEEVYMKKCARILFITPLPPPVHGSAMVSQWIRDSKLLNEEFDMDFINLSTSRKVEEIQKGGLLLNLKKAARFALAFIHTFWLLCIRRYDLCYLAITCHGKPFLKDFPFVMLCKLFRKKIIIHQHNKGMSKDVDKWPYNWALPVAYKNTKVMLLSEYLYEDVSKIVKKEQVVICPNGIPSALCIETQGKENAPHILFLSNLIESKGVYVLLEACQILQERGVDFICDFVGKETKDINSECFIKEIKRLQLDRRVFYHGPKYNDEKIHYWQIASLFVFPTFYEDECFPLVILEAMQHSLPVVTTSEGGIPDIVVDGKTGYICEKENAQQLADRIELLLKSPLLCRKMGDAGRKRYETDYTLEIFESNFCDALKNALI